MKPENRFIDSLSNRLPIKKRKASTKARERYPTELIHYEKMNNPYNSGTADSWYSGKEDLWIEYKFLPKIPVRDITVIRPYNLLSALQLEWLRGRYEEGRNVFVIIGCPEGGVVLSDLVWEQDLSTKSFRALLQSKDALADFIRKSAYP